MAKQDKKDFQRDQNGYESIYDKRQGVLGEDEYAEDAAEDSAILSSNHRGYLDDSDANRNQPAVQESEKESTNRETGSSFMRKFSNQSSEEDESLPKARVNKSPLFDEERDSVLADESTRHAPMHLLGEDDSTETTAARLFREKDYAAIDSEEPNDIKELSDKERRSKRTQRRIISALVVGAIAALLIFFAPNLQAAIFKTQDNSLIFNSPSGIYGPRAGMVEILLGILGLVLVISSFFGKRKTNTTYNGQPEGKRSNPFRIAGLIMLVLIPIGFASLFKFTEFRNDNIRFSSLFNQNKVVNYSQVQDQTIFNEGEDIFYRLQTSGAPESTIKITDFPVEAIKQLDLKFPVERNVSISTEVLNKIVEREIYTRDEALRLFINK